MVGVRTLGSKRKQRKIVVFDGDEHASLDGGNEVRLNEIHCHIMNVIVDCVGYIWWS